MSSEQRRVHDENNGGSGNIEKQKTQRDAQESNAAKASKQIEEFMSKVSGMIE